MIRNRSDLIGGAAILAVAGIFFMQTVGTGLDDDEIARNPVWFPRVLIVLLALSGLGLLVRGLLLADAPAPRPVWPRFALVAAGVGGYFAVFDLVGFLIASLVFLPAIAVLLGYRRYLVTLVVTCLFVAAVWYCFAEIFVVRPPGFGLDELAGWS
jgi:Tripartite tricarboxylate transporter TctB family